MQVEILHFCDIIAVLYFFIVWSSNFLRVGSIGFNFEQIFSFFGGEHVRISDESFFKVFAFADEEIHAFPGMEFSGGRADTAPDESGKFIISGCIRFAVDVITAEDFISPLTG